MMWTNELDHLSLFVTFYSSPYVAHISKNIEIVTHCKPPLCMDNVMLCCHDFIREPYI